MVQQSKFGIQQSKEDFLLEAKPPSCSWKRLVLLFFLLEKRFIRDDWVRYVEMAKDPLGMISHYPPAGPIRSLRSPCRSRGLKRVVLPFFKKPGKPQPRHYSLYSESIHYIVNHILSKPKATSLKTAMFKARIRRCICPWALVDMRF